MFSLHFIVCRMCICHMFIKVLTYLLTCLLNQKVYVIVHNKCQNLQQQYIVYYLQQWLKHQAINSTKSSALIIQIAQR